MGWDPFYLFPVMFLLPQVVEQSLFLFSFGTFRFADGKHTAEDYTGLRNYLSKKRDWAREVPLKILASAPDVGHTYWWGNKNRLCSKTCGIDNISTYCNRKEPIISLLHIYSEISP